MECTLMQPAHSARACLPCPGTSRPGTAAGQRRPCAAPSRGRARCGPCPGPALCRRRRTCQTVAMHCAPSASAPAGTCPGRSATAARPPASPRRACVRCPAPCAAAPAPCPSRRSR
eukprot:350152-Chlamydomonas_euryale.AAC.2